MEFDPNSQIAIIWSIADVQDDTVRPDLDDEQAMNVLKAVELNHNANYGVCWDTLRDMADKLYPRE